MQPFDDPEVCRAVLDSLSVEPESEEGEVVGTFGKEDLKSSVGVDGVCNGLEFFFTASV